MGSLERFIGILTEHYAGNFPVWLAPEQVRVMAVSRDQADYALEVTETLLEAGIRVESDIRNEKIGFKIREAEVLKVPWMLIVGGREAENKEVPVRVHQQGDKGVMKVDEVVKELLDATAKRS